MGKPLAEPVLLLLPQGLHDDIVEDGFKGEEVVSLEPEEEVVGVVPWARGVEEGRGFLEQWVTVVEGIGELGGEFIGVGAS